MFYYGTSRVLWYLLVSGAERESLVPKGLSQMRSEGFSAHRKSSCLGPGGVIFYVLLGGGDLSGTGNRYVEDIFAIRQSGQTEKRKQPTKEGITKIKWTS
jgi:hypothetical protein